MSCPDGPEGQLQAGGLPWAPRTTSRACEDDCPSADGPTGRPLSVPMPTRAKVTIRVSREGRLPWGSGEERRHSLVMGTGCSGSG